MLHGFLDIQIPQNKILKKDNFSHRPCLLYCGQFKKKVQSATTYRTTKIDKKINFPKTELLALNYQAHNPFKHPTPFHLCSSQILSQFTLGT